LGRFVLCSPRGGWRARDARGLIEVLEESGARGAGAKLD